MIKKQEKLQWKVKHESNFKDEIDFLFYLVMLLYSWKTVFSIYFSHKGIFFLLLLYYHPKATSPEYSPQDRVAHTLLPHLDTPQIPASA